MAIPIAQIFQPATAAQWLSTQLALCQQLGLDTTAWQSGSVNRTLLAIVNQALSQSDATVSVMIQGGFLDYAASGTVTYTAATGLVVTQPVSLDPSVGAQTLNPPLGWIDVLASSTYNVSRIQPTFASGTLNVSNASGSTYGPFAPGAYHVQNPSTGVTYSNVAALTIGPTTTNVPVAFQADPAFLGTAGNANQSTITSPVTSNVGVTVTNPAKFSGSNWENNTALAQRCRLKLGVIGATTSTQGVLNPQGPNAAYQFVALSATQAPFNAALTGGAINRVLVQLNTVTGVVTVTAAQPGGALEGCTQLAVSTCANNGSGAVRVTTAAAHNMATGDTATIAGVTGTTEANGTFVVTVIDGTHFDLTGPTFSHAYVSGGTVEGGTLGQLDATLQAWCVPDGVTETTQSATSTSVTFTATVVVPQAQASAYTSAIGTSSSGAIAAFFQSFPIGGITDNGTPNQLPINSIIAQLYAAGVNAATGQSYVIDVQSPLLSGSNANVTLSPTAFANLTTLTILVVGQ